VVAEPLPPSLGFAGSLERWAIRADGRLIAPPVRYGQTPRGAVVDVSPQSLTVGRTYGVSAFIGGGMVGSASFSFAP
jgi:hypothetical protein